MKVRARSVGIFVGVAGIAFQMSVAHGSGEDLSAPAWFLSRDVKASNRLLWQQGSKSPKVTVAAQDFNEAHDFLDLSISKVLGVSKQSSILSSHLSYINEVKVEGIEKLSKDKKMASFVAPVKPIYLIAGYRSNLVSTVHNLLKRPINLSERLHFWGGREIYSDGTYCVLDKGHKVKLSDIMKNSPSNHMRIDDGGKVMCYSRITLGSVYHPGNAGRRYREQAMMSQGQNIYWHGSLYRGVRPEQYMEHNYFSTLAAQGTDVVGTFPKFVFTILANKEIDYNETGTNFSGTNSIHPDLSIKYTQFPPTPPLLPPTPPPSQTCPGQIPTPPRVLTGKEPVCYPRPPAGADASVAQVSFSSVGCQVSPRKAVYRDGSKFGLLARNANVFQQRETTFRHAMVPHLRGANSENVSDLNTVTTLKGGAAPVHLKGGGAPAQKISGAIYAYLVEALPDYVQLDETSQGQEHKLLWMTAVIGNAGSTPVTLPRQKFATVPGSKKHVNSLIDQSPNLCYYSDVTGTRAKPCGLVVNENNQPVVELGEISDDHYAGALSHLAVKGKTLQDVKVCFNDKNAQGLPINLQVAQEDLVLQPGDVCVDRILVFFNPAINQWVGDYNVKLPHTPPKNTKKRIQVGKESLARVDALLKIGVTALPGDKVEESTNLGETHQADSPNSLSVDRLMLELASVYVLPQENSGIFTATLEGISNKTPLPSSLDYPTQAQGVVKVSLQKGVQGKSVLANKRLTKPITRVRLAKRDGHFVITGTDCLGKTLIEQGEKSVSPQEVTSCSVRFSFATDARTTRARYNENEQKQAKKPLNIVSFQNAVVLFSETNPTREFYQNKDVLGMTDDFAVDVANPARLW